VLGFQPDDVVDLGRRHLGDLDLLDDQLATADGDRGVGGFDTGSADGFLDRVGDRAGIVDRPCVIVSFRSDTIRSRSATACCHRLSLNDLDRWADIQAERLALFRKMLFNKSFYSLV
jgi:hypothetical protein